MGRSLRATEPGRGIPLGGSLWKISVPAKNFLQTFGATERKYPRKSRPGRKYPEKIWN
jgi:hypothetical protein